MGVVCIPDIWAKGLCEEFPFWEDFPVTDYIKVQVVKDHSWVSIVDG